MRSAVVALTLVACATAEIPDEQPDGAITTLRPVDAGTDAAVPDAPPCTPMVLQLLANPSFDSGRMMWVQATTNGDNIIQSQTEIAAGTNPAVVPHTVQYAAWFSGYDNADDKLVQTVVIPADTTALKLKGQRYIRTNDSCNTQVPPIECDFMFVSFFDSTGTVSVKQIRRWTNLDAQSPTTTTWLAFENTISLTEVPPGTYVFRMRGTSDVNGITSFFVDTLRLEATVCR